ncbi:MAG: sulfotransferase domain-containing protein [Geobacter sp.]|nr:sulfotransferase domain-containing protein [Geobacter sp.]
MKTNNMIDFTKCYRDLRSPELHFSVSSRDLRPDMDIITYLKVVYIYLDINQITDVFGNCLFPSRLYGGRPYDRKYALTEEHVRTLMDHGIGLSLTLTNHFFDDESYRHSYGFLKNHHRHGNSIVCTNDDLALRLRNDFPDFTLKASIIKNLNTQPKIENALKLYDYVTLPMDVNDDDDLLNDLTEKERIILFGNAGCAYTCPERSCYQGFSENIQGKAVTSLCSKERLPRLDQGQVWFDVAKLQRMGFTSFKMIPPQKSEIREISQQYSRISKTTATVPPAGQPGAWLCSYPKCGRSWLRFLIANYMNLHYDLGLEIDFHSIFKLLPNDGNDTLKGVSGYQFAADSRFPMVVASHTYWRKERFDGAPLIFMLRAVPDVTVSDYFHTSRLLNTYNGTLKEFIRDPQGGMHSYLRYLSSWADFIRSGQTQVHLVRYEELHARTAEVAAGVLSFLGIPVDRSLLAEAVKLSSFEAMSHVEQERGIAGHVCHFGDPEARRVRKGRVNGYLEYLDDEDMAYIEDIYSKYPLAALPVQWPAA